MSLIIEEDEECAERIPPWGAATIEAYDGRLERFLAAIERLPDLRAGFDVSGVELERLAGRRPDLVARMRALVREGRLGFYNGTWSQPHLQLFGAESNVRQLERGVATFARLVGAAVRVHAAQEADAHEQLPQLLGAFGLRFAVPPGFFSTLEFQGPHELVNLSTQGLRFVHGDEFTDWVGLDGSTIPLYLPQAGRFDPEREERTGLLHVPGLRISFPDMVEVDERWMADHRRDRFAVLDDELEARHAAAPPRSRARLWSDWSYAEGIRAEELGRADRRAEAAALAGESLGALARRLVGRRPDSFDAIWRTILTAQHHDAWCFSAPRLRGKAIAWLAAATREAEASVVSAARAIADSVGTAALPAGEPVVVFNPSPAPSTEPVTLELPAAGGPGGIEVYDAAGRRMPAEIEADGTRVRRVRFRTEIPGLGYRTCVLRAAGPRAAPERAFTDSVRIDGDGYRALIMADGTFGSLTVEPGGRELLDADARGNAPSACTPDGTPLAWSADGRATLVESDLGRLVRVRGSLGPRVRTLTEIRFVRGMRRIDIRLELAFEEAAIGDFFDDDTKLAVSWPLGFDGAIRHDIPFGAVRTRAGRPFFPVSWADVADGNRGFGLLTRGTPRHRVIGRTLSNIIAWGDDTDRIGNRAESVPKPWPKAFDQRLRGTHLIEYAVLPHDGTWTAAEMAQEARRWSTPLVAILTGRHGGELPDALTALSIAPAGIVPTAVIPAPDGLSVRMYEAAGRPTKPVITGERFACRGMQDLGGTAVETLGPLRIGIARCADA